MRGEWVELFPPKILLFFHLETCQVSFKEARIANIAINAIREINSLLNTTSTSNDLQQSTSSGVNQPARPGSSGISNALGELRSRFPTLTSNKTNTHAASSSRGMGRRGLAVHRGGIKDYTIKDIVIVGANVEKTPLGREEKLKLEQKNRVISGFSIDKTWNHKILYSKVEEQLPEDCKDIDFEFVKNCYGTLIKPRLANGVKIDGSILLKSIASTTTVYVRLFADDLDDLDDSLFDKSPFEFDAKKTDNSDDEAIVDTNDEAFQAVDKETTAGIKNIVFKHRYPKLCNAVKIQKIVK